MGEEILHRYDAADAALSCLEAYLAISDQGQITRNVNFVEALAHREHFRAAVGRRVIDREGRRDFGPVLAVAFDVVDVGVAGERAERFGMQGDTLKQGLVLILIDVHPALILADLHTVITDPVFEFRCEKLEVRLEVLGI